MQERQRIDPAASLDGIDSSTQSRREWLLVLPAAAVAIWNIASAPFLTEYLVEPVRDTMGVDRFVTMFAGCGDGAWCCHARCRVDPSQGGAVGSGSH